MTREHLWRVLSEPTTKRIADQPPKLEEIAMNLRTHCTVDSTGLNRMIALAQPYTKRTPAIAVNTAALVVARFAWSKTPVTTVQRIDTDLAISTIPVVSTRGARKGLPLKSGRRKITGVGPSTSGRFAPVPLAWLLVSARAKFASKYNRLTGSQWYLSQHPLKGLKVSQFARAMLAVVTRMLGARHSSTKFIQSCWIPAIRALEPHADPSVVRRRSSTGPSGAARFVENSGYATAAVPGVVAVCEIANDAGGAGTTLALREKHNEALWRVDAPALQEAIDDEAANIMRHVADKQFLEQFGPLRADGFVISL